LYTDDCLIIEINCIKSYADDNKDGYIYMKFEEIKE
jgi:hypothetical protein